MINSEIYYNQLQKKYSRSITLGLSRIKKALSLLDNPHLKLANPINIIGSDGKFTCLESISSFIEADKKLHNCSFRFLCSFQISVQFYFSATYF